MKYLISFITLFFAIVNIRCQTMVNDSLWINSQSKKINKTYGSIVFLHANYLENDFSDFMPLLDTYNIDILNSSYGVFELEFAGTLKNSSAGISLGYTYKLDDTKDSLDIEVNITQIGLSIGYNIINSGRFLLTPKVLMKWNRYRLINSDIKKRIPLDKYITERDIDVRFNQITGSIGMNLSYKMYNYSRFNSDYWTAGIYGGYNFCLNNKPWIYSRKNRLTSNNKIDIMKFSYGIFFSFNTDML